MEFVEIGTEMFEQLKLLHRAYKLEIGEDIPTESDMEKLKSAIEQNKIRFFGCVAENTLIACCSVCRTFSTFNYDISGVFEDFYIMPEYRRKGIARKLVAYAYRQSGVSTLTVGCADCDVEMYRALGFDIPLGNMMAMAGDA